MVNFDRCSGNCDTLDDLSGGICVPNKTDDVSLNVFNMMKMMMYLRLDIFISVFLYNILHLLLSIP